jgi:type IV pilus assembly protein PilW
MNRSETSLMQIPHRQSGLTLIELMVALAIGSFLMIGAITVFMQSRTTFRVTESLARLQENARFALDAIEPDIRMAHYWGLTARSYLITNRAAPTDPAGPGPNTCGNNWTINLNEAVQGTNNAYNWACAATVGPVAPASDTLIVRRVTEDAVPLPLTANTMYIQSSRTGLLGGRIFVGTTIPSDFDPATSETHRLVVNGYFVSQSSSIPNVPSLRMKTLLATGAIQEQEVLAGVEDMQVQFGVDTDVPGEPTAPNPNRGSIDRYVNPDAALITPGAGGFDPNAEVLAVRVWLRVRAERPENGFTDTATYNYAGQVAGPFGDNFRRMVVSKTIYLRNARPPF